MKHGPRQACRSSDEGAATVEFVFLGVMIMVPLLYLVIAVFEVQRNGYAVTQAAREAGRAFATADSVGEGIARAQRAAALALEDQGLSAGEHTTLRFVAEDAACDVGDVLPASGAGSLDPGAEFAVCVSQGFRMPGVPSILDAANNTVTGRYLVHVDDFRSARS